jgi:hypothetical protein
VKQSQFLNLSHWLPTTLNVNEKELTGFTQPRGSSSSWQGQERTPSWRKDRHLGEDADIVLAAILTKGSPDVIRRHVHIIEKMENWWKGYLIAHSQPEEENAFYPITLELVEKYIAHRVKQGCGCSAPDIIIGAVNNIVQRLIMPPLSTRTSPVITTLRDQLKRTRGGPLKEALPVPEALIGELELSINDCMDVAARMLAGVFLCMVYGSLRFDDQKHTKVSSLTMDDTRLRGPGQARPVVHPSRSSSRCTARTPLWCTSTFEID